MSDDDSEAPQDDVSTSAPRGEGAREDEDRAVEATQAEREPRSAERPDARASRGAAKLSGEAPLGVARAVERARAAQRSWAELDVAERARLVAPLKRRVLERAAEIARVVAEESGKPEEEALLADVLPNADLVDYWIDSIGEALAPSEIELDAIAFPGKLGRTHREPRGVVALITPWNYPVAIPLRTLVPALLAGNAVVLKPSEVVPKCGALLASLFDGLLPPGVVEVVSGGPEVGAALVAAGVDLIVFTGSVETGKKVAVAAAASLTPTSLELGGKDAAIVLADAPLERTARGVVWGAFTNAGQNCASIERLYVVEPVARALTDRIVALVKDLDPTRDLGRLATTAQAEKVAAQVDRAVADGAELLVGGSPEGGDRRRFPATVLRVTDEDTPLLREETFGPVLPIVVVKSVDDAVERTNASRFALTTSVWTADVERGRALAKRLKSGVVTINNHGFTAALPEAPWTGPGDTGSGITNGPHALAALTRPRFVLVDERRSSSELWWYPYGDSLRAVALAMARVRGGAGLFGRVAALFALLVALPRRLFGK